jgi:serine phosphatase RsbU (regulator of sigma subunit)/PAS domain-containing protein
MLAVAIVDAALGQSIVLIVLVVLGPLLASIRLGPPTVAAFGVCAVALVLLSRFWNGGEETQWAVRIIAVAAGSVLAVVGAVVRTRVERERGVERSLANLGALAGLEPGALAQAAAQEFVPALADGARLEVASDTEDAHWVAVAGRDGDPGRGTPVPSAGRDRGVVMFPLRLGERDIGTLRLVRHDAFTPAELEHLRRLAGRVALVLDNAVLLSGTRALAARVDTAHRRLAAIVDQMPAAVTIRDLSGQVTMANRRAQEIRERASPGEDVEAWFAAHPGRRGDGTAIGPDDWPHMRALRTGEVVRGEEFEFERSDGSRAAVQVFAAPIRDADGRISSVVSIFEDVSDEHRDRRALRWLAEVGRVLDRPHSVAPGIEQILGMLVADVADVGVVYLARPDGSISPSATAAERAGLEPLARRIAERERLGVPAGHPAWTCIRTRRTVVLRAGGDDADSQDAQAWLQDNDIAAALLVPITHARHAHGCIVLAATGRRVFDPRDVHTAELVAKRIALALENARLYGEQHRVATALQRDLLPRELPDWQGVELATLYRPAPGAADVGGDFFDLFATDDERVIALGDVSGKGVEAAAMTSLVRHAVRVAARAAAGPNRMRMVNDTIIEDTPGEQFCTLAWAALAPPRDGCVAAHVACAGHPPPLVVRAEGTVEAVGATGTLLGFFRDITVRDADLTLGAGDALVLYTDGVTEARMPDGSLVGVDGLARAVAGPGGPGCAATVLERVERVLEDATLRDDVAIVVAGIAL